MQSLFPLAEKIAARLIERKETIAVAESSTGGLIAAALLSVPGASAYFIGGGVVEAAQEFREWFLARVRAHTQLRGEQIDVAAFAVVPDLDMAGARGAAIAARTIVLGD